MKLRDARAGAALVLLAAVGALSAGAFSPAAQAWDVNALPGGFSASHLFDSGATACSDYYTIQFAGGKSGPICAGSPSFQADVDSFVDAHVCTVNPGADPALCSPPPPIPKSTTSTTTVVITAPVITTPANPPAGTTTTSPAITTTPAVTVPAPVVSTVTVTTATDLAAALTLIQQRLDWIEFRINALEDQVGLILGEEKNELPFTAPA